jgi:hypothetical protein
MSQNRWCGLGIGRDLNGPGDSGNCYDGTISTHKISRTVAPRRQSLHHLDCEALEVITVISGDDGGVSYNTKYQKPSGSGSFIFSYHCFFILKLFKKMKIAIFRMGLNQHSLRCDFYLP